MEGGPYAAYMGKGVVEAKPPGTLVFVRGMFHLFDPMAEKPAAGGHVGQGDFIRQVIVRGGYDASLVVFVRKGRGRFTLFQHFLHQSGKFDEPAQFFGRGEEIGRESRK